MKLKIAQRLILVFFFIQFGWGEIVNKDFYQEVKERNEKKYPKNFSSLLYSTVVSFQFKNIPKNSIDLGKKPELYLKFKKGYSPILYIENVSSFYANFFAPYESIIQKSGMFLGIDDYRTYKKFSKEYKFKISKIIEGYKVKVKEIEGLKGDYAEYYYRKNKSIFRAYFYEESKKSGEIKFFYQEKDRYTLPKRIIIILYNKKRGGMKEFFIDFIKFNFDNIPSKIF